MLMVLPPRIRGRIKRGKKLIPPGYAVLLSITLCGGGEFAFSTSFSFEVVG